MIGNITICNKLDRRDSATGLDVWYKTVLRGIKYKKDKITSVVNTEVSMGNSFTILIPFSDGYLQYPQWKNSSRDMHYTMSQGDYIFFGEVEEEVTPNNIIKLKSKYECCEVRSVEEVIKKHGVKIQLRVGGV